MLSKNNIPCPVTIHMKHVTIIRSKLGTLKNGWRLKINFGNYFGVSYHQTKPSSRIIRKHTKGVRMWAKKKQ